MLYDNLMTNTVRQIEIPQCRQGARETEMNLPKGRAPKEER